MAVGVKITLLVCLTVLLSCTSAMLYNEYMNRYVIITTNDNSVYIFDKKSTILNRCQNDQCHVINTQLPQTHLWNSSESNKVQTVNQNVAPTTFQQPMEGNYAQHPITTNQQLG